MRQLEDPMTTTYSDDECVLYLGSWDTSAQGGRECRCSNTQYNACLFSFRGPAVRWLGPTSNNQGFADVYIDEEFQCSLDGFSNTQHFRVVRFERRGLRTDTVHTIRIVVRKERNPSATDCSQAVESFQSVEPINYRARVAAKKDDEYAQIRNGTKLFATANAWFAVSPAAQA